MSRSPREGRLAMALIVIVLAQLMVVLDATIVTTALPHIQRALGFTGPGLQWVVTGYAISFGGLMLLGGRAGDLLGRKKVLVAGLALFSIASLAGGLAQSAGMLLAMRVLQGAGGALIAPTALALIATTFPEGTPRNRAMGVYAAMSASGAAIGMISGGLLTTYVSWRWVLFVNVPVGVVTALLALAVLPEAPRSPGRLDLTGAITATGAVAALVYGLSNAPADRQGVSHWGDARVVVSLVGAALLLTAFAAVERRSTHPLLPLRILSDPTRAGSYLAMLALATAITGILFFTTLFLQDALGYSALQSGLSFLPLAVTTLVTSQVVARLLVRTGPRLLMPAGGLLTALGSLWFSRLTEHSDYLGGLLGPMLVISVGFGILFVPLTLTGTSGVAPSDAGVAASLLNTGQQLGGAVGLAALGTVVWTTFAHQATRHPAHALAAGIERGFLVSFAVTLLVPVLALTLIRPLRPAPTPEPAPAEPVQPLEPSES